MKTNKTTRHSFLADNCVNIYIPSSWQHLNNQQRLWLFEQLHEGYNSTDLAVKALVRFSGIRVLSYQEHGWLCSLPVSRFRRRTVWFQTWQIHSSLQHLAFIFQIPRQVVNLSHIGKLHAVDAELHNVPFETYIICENLYQGYIASKNKECLQRMAKRLYHRNGQQPSAIKFSDGELFSVFFWWYSLKEVYSVRFPHFFRRVDSSGGNTGKRPDMVAVMNAEIRALTGGDVTKEPFVFSFDAYRALTELNEKAREAKELQDKLKKK